MEYSEEEISLAFEHFVFEAQKIVDNYLQTNFPTLPKQKVLVKEGSVYWKLIREDEPGSRTIMFGHSMSVHAFVRKKDGAIFRPASYKAPQTKGKSAIRAYVTDEWAASVLTPHGVCYAR
jgi:hypothetical protein